MTELGRAVLAEALGLSETERADIAAELLASFHQPDEMTIDELEQVWAYEIQRRVERVRGDQSIQFDPAARLEAPSRPTTRSPQSPPHCPG